MTSNNPLPKLVPSTEEATIEANIAWSSATDLAVAYRAGTLTPTQVAATLLNRIERHNPALNAFATVLPDLVMEQVKRAEEELNAGHDRGPLHGVPIGIKDLIAVKGWPTRFGSTVAPVETEDEDAEIVARLRQAGAIVMGKTTLLEYAYGAVHPDVGPTWNPYYLQRTAGGSSGGSAAALGAGLVPLAIGTDTGGSIRIPAAYCGVVGLKPTFGRLSLNGVFPLSWSLDAVGPMARTVPDLLVLFQALDGAETVKNQPALEGRRFGIPEDYIAGTDVAPGINELFRGVLKRLSSNGAIVEEINFQALANANEVLVDILRPEATVIHDQNMRSMDQSTQQTNAYSDATFTQLRSGYKVPATTYIAAKQKQEQLKGEFQKLIDGFDALLMPAVGFVAPAEDPHVDDPAGAAEMHFSGPFNVLGTPALALPIGLVDDMPASIQLVTAHGADRVAIELAAAIESISQHDRLDTKPSGF